MAKRRPNGDGLVRKREDGRWEGRIVAGHKKDGSPIYRAVFAEKQSELMPKLHQLKEQYAGVELTEDSSITLGEWLERWMEEYKKPLLRPSTYTGYSTDMSEAFLQMAGVFSQLELAMIRARVRSGMANAKAKGARIGRPQVTANDVPAVFLRHYPSLKSGKLNISEIARLCDLSRTTVYKYIELLEK